MESYGALKTRQSKEVNDFKGIFFAFNNDQFKEGMQSLGLTIEDTKQISSLGAGGYILKTRGEEFVTLFARHDKERQELRKNEKELLKALVYELQNHEYCISFDIQPTLDSLGYNKEDIDPKILKKACQLAK